MYLQNHRIYHEATTTGSASDLATLIQNLPGAPFTCKTKAMCVKAGTPVDRDTLEPLHPSRGGGDEMNLLVESGLDMALSLDLLRHCGSGGHCKSAVVLTHRCELGEALDLVDTR